MFSSELKFYLLLPLVFLLAFWRPKWGSGFFGWFCREDGAVARLANRRGLAVLVVGCVAFVAGAAPCWIRMPAPKIHDEFSYLLAADTFAHGRLTNPPHPLWEHFESIHILQQPTYASKYPPGQGALLAVGQILGHPILGVWLGLGLAAAAVCWMLQAWLLPRWALLGGLLIALHPQMITWGYNYCGGAVATIGGAFLARGMRRMVETSREGAWSLGIGLFILANSRPYEGLVVSVFVVVAGLVLLIRAGRDAVWNTVRGCGAPLAICAIATLSWLGFYNYRVTGNALHMPYALHVQQYMVAPIFLGQSFRPEPVYRHREIREFHTNSEVELMGSRKSLAGNLLLKINAQLQGWLWMSLWVPLLAALPWAVRGNRWLQVALVCLAGLFAGLLIGPGIFPHYAAPGVALYIFVVVEGIRQWCRWRPEQGTGVAFVCWLCLLCVLTVPVVWGRLLSKNAEGWYRDRARVLAELEAKPGRHLVFMRYGPEHNPNREWVFNGADLAETKVLWAREMTAEKDQQLREAFPDRQVWVVEPDRPNPEPVPYFPREVK